MRTAYSLIYSTHNGDDAHQNYILHICMTFLAYLIGHDQVAVVVVVVPDDGQSNKQKHVVEIQSVYYILHGCFFKH